MLEGYAVIQCEGRWHGEEMRWKGSTEMWGDKRRKKRRWKGTEGEERKEGDGDDERRGERMIRGGKWGKIDEVQEWMKKNRKKSKQKNIERSRSRLERKGRGERTGGGWETSRSLPRGEAQRGMEGREGGEWAPHPNWASFFKVRHTHTHMSSFGRRATHRHTHKRTSTHAVRLK